MIDFTNTNSSLGGLLKHLQCHRGKSHFSVFSTTNETRSPRFISCGRIGTCEMAQIDGSYSAFQPMERGFPSNNRAKCMLMNIRIINLSPYSYNERRCKICSPTN